ncbi:Lsr2 family DNA-binding protein [Actinomadura violacea]|uniref:Lsr2 family protein n=1 Tax=Actinomadura violacea TaxID=2819934 RepID=A0ABS3RWK6_9ACTN|nr:Lsr2 family protein [Actinomadura violacea]MBO2461143.1 Lsr2 family protein [Actinomadura violacea]
MTTPTSTASAAELTERERAALTAVAIGLPHEVAARHVGMADRPFRRVLAGAARKLGAAETIHAVAIAAALGQIRVDDLRARTCPIYPTPLPRDIRAWAAEHGIPCPARGPIPSHVRSQYEADTLAQRRRQQHDRRAIRTATP